MKQLWSYLLTQPFHWVFLAFFQPRRLEQEMHLISFQQRFFLILRTILPVLLFVYSISLIGRLIFVSTHILPSTGMISLLLDIFKNDLLGIAFGIVGGITLGANFGIVGGVAGGVALGVIGGTSGGVALGVAFGIAFGIVTGAAGGVVGGIAGGVVVGFMVGFVGNSIFIGAVAGVSFIFSYYIYLFRLPLYPFSVSSIIRTYFATRNTPDQVFIFLQRSSLYWDELVYLPLPYLKDVLLLAYNQNVEQALKEIAFIVAEHPYQSQAAQSALLEGALHDLAGRKTIIEIAKAGLFLDTLFAQKTELLAVQWVTSIALLRDASQDALRFTRPIGRQKQIKALQDMSDHVENALLNNPITASAKSYDQLDRIVSSWLLIAQQEQVKLQNRPEHLGHMDNPYNPGKVLKPDDPLFFGRRDLVHMIEEEMSKGSRPTLLMTGERRMGKSSTLLQLPRLLGSHFFPIFYDLQRPGILTNTSIFLSSIADGIVRAMRDHGLSVRRLEYLSVRGFGQQAFLAEALETSISSSNESSSLAFYLFEQWFRSVEEVLEGENRTLLLLFDEFEKLDSAEQKRNFDLPLLLDWFRNLIQYHPRVVLLFSGVHNFGEMGRERNLNWSSYFVNVQTLRVSFLQADEARRLIATPVPDFPGGEIYGEGVVDGIIEQTGCHPFLVQAVCSALIDQLNAQKKPRAELSDLEDAVERTLSNWWDTYFRDLWVRTDELQRLCLIALLKPAPASLDQIQQQSGLERKHIRQTLQILLSRDLVSEDGPGLYSISTPLFRRWVERFAEV